MRAHDSDESRAAEGGPSAGGRQSFQVLYAGSDREGFLERFEATYTVTAARSPRDVREALGPDIDCLVAEAELIETFGEHVFERAARESVSVVVVSAANDPSLLQSVARQPNCDIVLRDGVVPEAEGDEAERLEARIGEIYRDSVSDIGDTVIEVARLLMGAAPDEVDTKIEWGLQSIGEALDAERCAVYRHDGNVLDRTHQWYALGHDGESGGSQSVEAFPGFESHLTQFEVFATGDDSDDADIDVPEGFAGDIEGISGGDGATPEPTPYLQRCGLDGFLAVPVVIDWELEWVLAVGRSDTQEWSEAVRRQLRTVGDLVGHTLRRNHRRREIERQNERLERFASVISHDLQNPLNVITGFCDLAMESRDPDDIRRIETAAERMETILTDLHTLVREAEKLGETETVDVGNLVASVTESVEMHDATVEVGDPGRVEADPSRFRQVFENFFRNAIEHAGTDVTIRVEGIDGGFAVEDDGPGIPESKREAVFEEGHTGADGSGLGLSIVETVIEAHGWTITATEGSDGGARFEITGVQSLQR